MCQIGLDSTPSGAREGQGGCRIVWARSWHPLNCTRTVSGFGPGLAGPLCTIVRTRMGVGQLDKATVPVRTGGRQVRLDQELTSVHEICHWKKTCLRSLRNSSVRMQSIRTEARSHSDKARLQYLSTYMWARCGASHTGPVCNTN